GLLIRQSACFATYCTLLPPSAWSSRQHLLTLPSKAHRAPPWNPLPPGEGRVRVSFCPPIQDCNHLKSSPATEACGSPGGPLAIAQTPSTTRPPATSHPIQPLPVSSFPNRMAPHSAAARSSASTRITDS